MLVLILSLLVTSHAESDRFSKDFLFGAATSAYQTEGEWNEDGRGESIWCEISHKSGKIVDNSTGDVACDSYHQWKRDVDNVKSLGLDTYRISICWSRVLPDGNLTKVNEKGLTFYKKLISGLTEAGITPIVTLFHFDLPQALQDKGGVMSPKFPKWFENYADFIFSQLSGQVKYWITINEPVIFCSRDIFLMPLSVEEDRATYICSKNMLLAHASAYRVYKRMYEPFYRGKVSIANNYLWVEEMRNTEKESELVFQYFNGRFAHPLLSEEGGWPPQLEEFMEKFSKEKGYNTSLLEPFTDSEKKMVKGAIDFVAFNYYYGLEVITDENANDNNGPNKLFDTFQRIGIKVQTITNYAPGIKYIMQWISKTYPSSKKRDYLITENGKSINIKKSTNDDFQRIEYIKNHLENILEAIEEGESVLGYTYWSLMDTFEWTEGFTTKFGLYNVNFETLDFTERMSAKYYKCVIEKRRLSECDTY